MALATTHSVALVGADAHLVHVELDIGQGVPGFRIVGLPNASVREAEQRIRAALIRSKLEWPNSRKTANLAPGALRKEGTHFDLALAIAVAAADDKLKAHPLQEWVFVGELALDGGVRRIRGVLPAALECKAVGKRGIVCPLENAPEAALVEGIEVVGVDSLSQCVDFFRGNWVPEPVAALEPSPAAPPPDMRGVRGHPFAKRALEVAAAGAHNLLMVGPPGSGKTMLAQRMPGLLPPMSFEESLDVTRIHSVAGLLPPRSALVEQRPFRAPHHHVSLAGLIGGGSGLIRPGELSLAHHGTLFMDELALFRRDVLDSLRGPLEDNMVRIARSSSVITFPCKVSLIAAMNPCPCGYLGDAKKECRCNEYQIDLYNSKVSGPLLDRIDLQATMSRLSSKELLGASEGESTASISERVVAARRRQTERYGDPTVTNASVPRSRLDPHVEISSSARSLLSGAIEDRSLTGRGLDRVLRVARTVADLEGEEKLGDSHVTEALHLRLQRPALKAVS